MKKFFSVLTAAICLTACAFSFTACGDKTPEHTHNWSTTYTPDEMLIDGVLVEVSDRHYQTCDGCDEKKYSNHDYGTSGVCVCGKHKPETPVTGVTLDKNTLTLEIGGTATLIATVAPENATDKSVTWESDKTNIATVDSTGKVTAISDGTAIITVKTANGKTATCTVTVNAAVIPVTGIELNKTELTLEIGDTETLTASVTPENATDKAVTWTVAPAGVATVENGVVTAIKDGTATITATANGKSATCSVTVNAPLTNAQVLQFLNDNVLMNAAKDWATEQGLNASKVNETTVKNIIWFVTKDGDNIASVNLVFTYERTETAHHINLCKIEFTSPLTPQNVRNNETGTSTYTEIYSKTIPPTIQTEHTALTNAICNKLFGEKQNATRYIIDNGFVAANPQLGDVSTFTVIEVFNNHIKENSIAITYANTDDGLISNLNDTTKYLTYGDAKNIAITGDKLENNNEPFFG